MFVIVSANAYMPGEPSRASGTLILSFEFVDVSSYNLFVYMLLLLIRDKVD